VADQIKHKTPEELGEAVGKKIEELFGGMFSDEANQGPQVPASAPEKKVSAASPASSASPRQVPIQSGTGRPPATGRPSAPVTVPKDPKEPMKGFEELAESIEALILSMEWEVNPESATELSARFKDIEPLLPVAGPARNILAMNQRVLARYNAPEAAPHRSLNKFLQQSVSGLKFIHASQGKRPLGQDLIAGLTQGYKEIMAAPVVARSAPASGGLARGKGSGQDYGILLNELGSSIRSLEEVSQRLARILGALRQGGEMSGEEIRRRLGTLEGLFSDRMEKLSSFYKALTSLGSPEIDGRSSAEVSSTKPGPDGLLMVVWEGMPLAIPAAAVTALFPLTRAQAEQFAGKSIVVLASHQVRRLPLKKPAGSRQTGVGLPSWLVRLAWGEKEFFLLADKSVGYRRTPEGADPFRDKQIRIGGTSFAVLNLAAFR